MCLLPEYFYADSIVQYFCNFQTVFDLTLMCTYVYFILNLLRTIILHASTFVYIYILIYFKIYTVIAKVVIL